MSKKITQAAKLQPIKKSTKLAIELNDQGDIVHITGRDPFINTSKLKEKIGSNPGNSDQRHALHYAEHIRGTFKSFFNDMPYSERKKFVDDFLEMYNVFPLPGTLQEKIKTIINYMNSLPSNLRWGPEKDNKGIENARAWLNKNKESFITHNQLIHEPSDKFPNTTGIAVTLMRDKVAEHQQPFTTAEKKQYFGRNRVSVKDIEKFRQCQRETYFEMIYDNVTHDALHDGTSAQFTSEQGYRLRLLDIAINTFGPDTEEGRAMYMMAFAPHIPTMEEIDQQPLTEAQAKAKKMAQDYIASGKGLKGSVDAIWVFWPNPK